MVMPFIRLLAIYAVVILAITAFFQRDKVMDLLGFSQVTSETEAPETMAPAPDSDAVQEVAKVDEIVTPEPDVPADEGDAGGDTDADESTTLQQAPAPVETAEAAGTVDVAARLQQARQAYWTGDFFGALKLYEALVEDAPQSVAANGELGNMYYSQGRFDEASEYYFAAGKIMVANGNSRQLLPLLQTLQGVAPVKAAALRVLLNE